MKTVLLSKSIRLTAEDRIGLADIVANDPRVERGPSEALRICFEYAALNIPNWKDVKEKAKSLDYPDGLKFEGCDTKTFLVPKEVFGTVLESINTRLGTTRPRVSFITRLCIYNTRLKLHSVSCDTVPASLCETDGELANSSFVDDLDMLDKLIQLRKKNHPGIGAIYELINKYSNG